MKSKLFAICFIFKLLLKKSCHLLFKRLSLNIKIKFRLIEALHNDFLVFWNKMYLKIFFMFFLALVFYLYHKMG